MTTSSTQATDNRRWEPAGGRPKKAGPGDTTTPAVLARAVADSSVSPPSGKVIQIVYPPRGSVRRIFVAGDARHGSGKRVAAAVGEGSATISVVHQYLRTV